MTRITLPSRFGLTPRSESRMAFSTAAACDLSNGVTASVRGSGTPIEATAFSGVGLP